MKSSSWQWESQGIFCLSLLGIAIRGRYGSPGCGLYQFSSWKNYISLSARHVAELTTAITITLCGGQGRSLRLKLFVVKALGPSPSASPRGPATVASSPGAKAIIVDDTMTPPH